MTTYLYAKTKNATKDAIEKCINILLLACYTTVAITGDILLFQNITITKFSCALLLNMCIFTFTIYAISNKTFSTDVATIVKDTIEKYTSTERLLLKIEEPKNKYRWFAKQLLLKLVDYKQNEFIENNNQPEETKQDAKFKQKIKTHQLQEIRLLLPTATNLGWKPKPQLLQELL